MPANGRINRWVQHLLDLSMRNRLLNLKNISFTLPLVCDNLEQMEDNLSQRALKVLNYANASRTEDSEFDSFSITDDQAAASSDSSDISPEKPSHTEEQPQEKTASPAETQPKEQKKRLPLDNSKILVDLTQKEFEKRIVKLYRQAKLDIDEGGVNTLFLTLGSLLWTDEKSRGKFYAAPIILIPVQLSRENAKSPFFVNRSDDEPVINPTLLELMRKEFGVTFTPEEQTISEGDSGLDITGVLTLFKNKIANMDKWSLEESAWLGRFSFDKFIMYTDLNSRWKELAANGVVSQLINLSETESGNGVQAGQAGTLDAAGNSAADTTHFLPENTETPWTESSYSDLYIPSSADASQKQAILQSKEGKSFVLYGPPGTGKSQTITNLIAFNLALGRKVLFVSEKRAALEVVYKRLAKIGLGPYCLELHSNKAVKRAILDQFQEVYESGKKNDEKARWDSACSDMSATELELNNYVRQLHKPILGTITPYGCFGWLAEHQKDVKTFSEKLYDGSFDANHTLAAIVNQADTLQSHATQITPAALKALAPIRSLNWTPGCEDAFAQAAKDFAPAVDSMQEQYNQVNQKLDLPNLPSVSDRMRLASNLMAFLQTPGALPGNTLSAAFADFMPIIDLFIDKARQLITAQKALENFDLSHVLNIAPKRLSDLIQFANNSFFLFRYFRRKSVVNEYIKLMPPEKGNLTFALLESAVEPITQYQQAYLELQKYTKTISQAVGDWTDGTTDFTALSDKLLRGRKLREILTVDGLKESDQQRLFDFVCTQSNANTPEFSALNAQFQTALKAYQTALKDFNQTVPTDEMTIDQAHDLVAFLPSAGRELRQFALWAGERAKAREIGLEPLAKALESGAVEANENALIAAEGAYRWKALQQELASNPILKNFDALNQNRAISQFRELDASFMKLAQKKIIALLSARTTQIVSQSSQRGSKMKEEGDLLRREIGKKMRFIPLRVLFQRAPNLTRQLKPCFLMSPLSVAQYLPTNDAGFDLVVFDEASQITTWDAVGVIARGKQAVIVGDPKQLPPTTFFQKQDGAKDAVVEDESDEIEDLESILDECIAIGMDGMYLKTHYRSRHESLIAFSNHFYYQDALGTFPSPDRAVANQDAKDSAPAAAKNDDSLKTQTRGVHFEFVPNGVYDRSKTRTNKAEAQRVVEIVVERLTDSQTAARSIGIATFSSSQKDLIEDLLDEAAKKYPELAAAMSDAAEEPLFVKNLENVQGDERDCIIFSIGYAPDANGSFAMNFGPLNKNGGQRRLNVAVTRAKEEVIVVSSIHSDQIDLDRTSSVGPAHLKAYLEYAQAGHPTWDEDANSKKPSAAGDSSAQQNFFAQCVADFLTENGYKVERNIGFSEYKVDVAVIDPKNPRRYCLGIECDGKVYKNAKTARDRDILRPSVMEGLGWNHCRIWSTEWFLDPEKCKADLLKTLESHA